MNVGLFIAFLKKSVEECPIVGSVRVDCFQKNDPLGHPNIILHYFICNALSNNEEHDNKKE